MSNVEITIKINSANPERALADLVEVADAVCRRHGVQIQSLGTESALPAGDPPETLPGAPDSNTSSPPPAPIPSENGGHGGKHSGGRSAQGAENRSRILAFLAEHPDSTARQIAAEIEMKRNSVAGPIAQLMDAGAISKHASPEDARVKLYRLAGDAEPPASEPEPPESPVAPQPAIRAAILTDIGDGAKSCSGIADRIGATPLQTKTALDEMVALNLLKVRGAGGNAFYSRVGVNV